MKPTLTILICIYFFSLKGQNTPEGFVSKTYTTENGLPYNHVLSMVQDHTGFLWIATWDGLSRFDGYEFRNYYPKPGDSTAIPFFVVNHLFVDHLNNVWIHFFSRPLVRYNRELDNFEWMTQPGIRDSFVRHIAQSNDKKSLFLFFPDDRKIFRIETNTRKFREIRYTSPEIADQEAFWNNFGPIAMDKTGIIWALRINGDEFILVKGTWQNDSVITLTRTESLRSEVNPTTFPDATNQFEPVVSGSGRTWFFTGFGIFYTEPRSKQLKKFEGTPDFADFPGVSRLTWLEKGTAHLVYPDEKRHLVFDKPALSSYYTWYTDPSRSIWYGNISEKRTEMGLTRLTETPHYFHHYLTGTPDEIPVFGIVRDIQGRIWAGTRGEGFILRINDTGKAEKVSYAHLFPGEKAPKVRSMVADSSGIWMGCTQNNMLFYDYQSEKFRKYKLVLKDARGKETDLQLHNILKKGNDLIINGKGVFLFHPETGLVERKFSFPYSDFFSISRGNANDYWLGIYHNTVVHLNDSLEEISRYRIGNDLNLVESVCAGDSGDVWAAIMGGGLGHAYTATGKTEFFTTADGLSNNTTYSIVKDKKGLLWISTNQGISRFNPATRKFRNFGKNDGLQIEEFDSDAFLQIPEGEIYFGGINGIVRFHPDSIYEKEKSATIAPLVITRFQVSGVERRFSKAVYELDSLELRKGDNNFQVGFACINFPFAEQIKYRYRLQGTGEDWTITDHRNRQINYTNLLPGRYLLEIEATNPEGEWASHKSLHIRIPFRFYETWWFRIVVILLIFSLIALVVFLVIRQIRLKAMQKQDELALENIRKQMNPHFIYNSLNSINYFIMKNDRVSANSYIADFSRLIRSILTNMSDDFVPLDRELQSIADYLKLEHLRFGDRFEYQIDNKIPEEEFDLEVMPGMVQPFIENAIWHGIRNLDNRKGAIFIRFILPEEQGYIRCVIEDTGVGRKLAAAYRNELPGRKSRGVGIVAERLKLINNLRNSRYSIVVEDLFPNREETGTRVTVDIPVKGY